MGNVSQSNTFFALLERTIKILVVDDDLSMVELFYEHLNSYRLYDITRAFCTKEADSILSSSKRYHVCLMDLGLYDINNDEYYLLKKYSPKISFIVVTARDTLDKGFQSKSYGAIAAMNKPLDFYKLDIFNLVNEAFIRSLITPEHTDKCKPIIQDAVRTFISAKPTSIIAWAEEIGVEKRYFRKVWLECFGYQPKYVVWLYKMFSYAFLYCNSRYCKKFRLKTGDDLQFKGIECFEKRVNRYYNKHKKDINRILT